MGMTSEENAMFYNLHKNGEITYIMWVEIALGIYKNRKNLRRADIEKIITAYNYFPFAKELVKYLQQKYIIVLVSCAMDILVEKVANELGIKYFKSLTKFSFDNLDHIAEVKVDDRTGDEAKNKVHFLQEICSELGVELRNVACVGDGSNDYELFRKTKRGITFNTAKKDHKQLAWKVVANLKEIKSIL